MLSFLRLFVPRGGITKFPLLNAFIPWPLPVRDGEHCDQATEQTAEDQPKNGPVNIVMGESRQNDPIGEKHASQTTNKDAAYEANGNGEKEVGPLTHGAVNSACSEAHFSGT